MISFALVWIFGFGGFYDTAFIEEARAGIAGMFGPNIASPYAIMIVLVVLGGTLGLFVAIGGIGEELGWRGFLVPELYKHYSFTTTALVSGVIWSVYHWPLLHLLAAPHLEVSPWPLMASVTVAGIGLSTILAWFRLRSGSVWTAVIFHMALNVHTQGFFQNLTTKTSWLTDYISGEYGVMLAFVVSPIAVWFWMKCDRIDVGHSNI
jgi:membrane protease YdiL (CAAX protease family)